MARTKIRPMDDRIVIEQNEAEERTAGGILLPDQARERPQRGKTVATGPGKLLDSGERGKMSIKVGDQVYYGKYSGSEVEIDGQKYTVIRENDVLAIAD